MASTFGRRCRIKIRASRTPTARAATTYSSWRVAITKTRTTRAYVVQYTSPMATMALAGLGPRAAIRASASRITGNARNTSTTRLIAASTHPPK